MDIPNVPQLSDRQGQNNQNKMRPAFAIALLVFLLSMCCAWPYLMTIIPSSMNGTDIKIEGDNIVSVYAHIGRSSILQEHYFLLTEDTKITINGIYATIDDLEDYQGQKVNGDISFIKNGFIDDTQSKYDVEGKVKKLDVIIP